MLIVDSQVHIWAANTPDRPWPARHKPHRETPITAEALLGEMDGAGVKGCVLVPPSWEGDRNDVCLAAARKYPDRFAVMGRLDPTLPESRGLIADWRKQKGMLGVRFTMHRPTLRFWLTEGHVDWLWPLAEKHGVPVMTLAVHTDMPLFDKVAEKHPGLKLTIDHLGLTTGKGDEAFKGLDHLLALAKRPNVAVKVSCLPFYSVEPYPFRDLHQHIRRVYDAFGPKRMFWGTDLSRLPCPYKQAVTYFTDEIPWLSAADKEWIMGKGVCEWIGWNLQR